MTAVLFGEFGEPRLVRIGWRGWRVVLGIVVSALCVGCSQMAYYVQAAQGQFSLLSKAKPIDDWLVDPQVDGKLKMKLAQAKRIRQFAVAELGLPDNNSYRNYADIDRRFVLWNIVATPELSLKPEQWCFPIAGCVSYRGYYRHEDAEVFAALLKGQGYDVQLSGVPAYSTLGWFNDPFISTFIHYPDGELARLIFHELAHQVVYVKDDSQFNESFATAVEEAGVQRWLTRYGDAEMRNGYAIAEARKKDFLSLLLKHRNALESNYGSAADDGQKRLRKAAIFQDLKNDYQVLKITWNGYAGYDRWFDEPLSNAHLASVATYHDLVPGFRGMLQQAKNFDAFYIKVKVIAQFDIAGRHQKIGLAAHR
jgi:predicted aminopeptidase